MHRKNGFPQSKPTVWYGRTKSAVFKDGKTPSWVHWVLNPCRLACSWTKKEPSCCAILPQRKWPANLQGNRLRNTIETNVHPRLPPGIFFDTNSASTQAPKCRTTWSAIASKQNEPLRFRSGSLLRCARRRKLLLYDQRRALHALTRLHGEDVVSWAHALNVQSNLLNV